MLTWTVDTLVARLHALHSDAIHRVGLRRQLRQRLEDDAVRLRSRCCVSPSAEITFMPGGRLTSDLHVRGRLRALIDDANFVASFRRRLRSDLRGRGPRT